MKKKSILVFTKFYLPGYKAGGPIRSVSNIVEALGDDFQFKIITRDRDSFDENSYNNINVNKWNAVGKAEVFYMSPDHQKLSFMHKLVKETACDVIYLNSFFDPIFSLFPLLSRNFSKKHIPVILAPRGEFSEGALKLKGNKKRLFISAISTFKCHRNIGWQASTAFEKQEIKEALGNVAKHINIAPNIPQLPSYLENLQTEERKFNGQLKVIFISRISPKKNLHFALNVLKKFKKPLKFQICGVVDDELYWKKCNEIIDNLPSNIEVDYIGSIPHHEVNQRIRNNHIFFLPTKGENYGHAIVESFFAGTPALIARTTPWRELETAGVGWDLPLDNPSVFLEKLNFYYYLLQDGNPRPRKEIQNWIKRKMNYTSVMQANRKLFNLNSETSDVL